LNLDGAALVQYSEQLVHLLEHRHEGAYSRDTASSLSVRMAFTAVYVIRALLLMTPS
jgi:hypothetical protein